MRITYTDYPDPDVIRVGNIFYMVSTTMYFMPGCEILRSYDLVHWEHAAYVYDRLDSTPAQCLEDGKNAYGQGMWAASIRYHDGVFYVCFIANDTHKTYLYRASDITGPWKKSYIEGFYHDNSILFDDDGRVYIVYGNREIYLTELEPDLSGPKKGGLNRMIVKDSDDSPLGYEGSHIYRINGRYYVFFINIPADKGRRVQSCFTAESLEDEFKGKIVFNDDCGYHNMGIAQGGIVDTPSGKWYSVMFQDSGAVGRIPVLVPVRWGEDHMPVFGDDAKVPDEFFTEPGTGYEYEPLTGSDDFKSSAKGTYDSFGFRSFWQFNHEPDTDLIEHDSANGILKIRTDRTDVNPVSAKNILTQRCVYPGCEARVTVDASGLNEGDRAGLCLLESEYAYIAAVKQNGALHLEVCRRDLGNVSFRGERHDTASPDILALAELEAGTDTVTFIAKADFDDMRDTASFYYVKDGTETKLGPDVKLRFLLDHFTGVRFGLFIYSTVTCGGYAAFSDFRRKQEGGE